MKLRVTVSPGAEAAYLSFKEQQRSDARTTIVVELSRYGIDGVLNLDMSDEHKLTGIEFIPAALALDDVLVLADNPFGYQIDP